MSTSGLAAAKPKRLISLDVARGITLAFMIMVNNSRAGSWHFMNHAAWNGFTPTDLVFPTFLFIVGVTTVFGTEARLAKGDSRGKLAWHTLVRAFLLILFGFIVNNAGAVTNGFHLQYVRFYGVLPRIGLCYLVVSLFYLVDKRVLTKALLLVVCLLGYWAMMTLVPIPGAGLPGKDVPFLDKQQNIVAYVDRQVMPGHLYEDETHNVRDPEGLLSTIPAIGTALIGMIVGIGLRKSAPDKKKALALLAGSLACLAVGYFWSLWFPLNKKLWTSSFVLVTAGWSLALLTFTFWAVEIKNWRKGWTFPWLVFGSNSIVAYMVSELLWVPFAFFPVTLNGHRASLLDALYTRVFAPNISPSGLASFCWSAFFAAICFIPVWVLYKKKIFVKI